MDLIPLRNGLFHDVRLNEIIGTVVGRLNELKLIDRRYVGDAEFVLYLMNILEHLVEKKDKIDKKALLKEIFRNHYGATEGDLVIIDKMVDFLHASKQVKKVSYYKIFKCALKEWFKKK
jgi:hypothetical protein